VNCWPESERRRRLPEECRLVPTWTLWPSEDTEGILEFLAAYAILRTTGWIPRKSCPAPQARSIRSIAARSRATCTGIPVPWIPIFECSCLASVQENDDLGMRKLGPTAAEEQIGLSNPCWGLSSPSRRIAEDWLKNHSKDLVSVLPSTAPRAAGGVLLHRFPTNDQKNTH